MTTVYIILLNWNGWENTIQCLESLLNMNYPDFRVIICDNCSTDKSMEKIKAWAKQKSIEYLDFNRIEAENDGNPDNVYTRLVLIQNESNSGFSAGNNPGIRYALKKNADYIWLLNNDTLVETGTLNALVSQIQSDSSFGIAGAVIYATHTPSCVQAYGGGRIIPFTGMDRFVLKPSPIDYVTGACMLIKREVIDQTGLLDESFFFYWEDVDFSRRAIKKGWKLTVAPNANVYHKFSASVGKQSLKSDLFKVASLIHFYKKNRKFTWLAPVAINILGMIINRIIRRQFNRVLPIIKEMFKSIFTAKKPVEN
jgi:GT2 family glycosyltransferase